MNQKKGLSYFIYGKLLNEGTYGLVAHTADLADKYGQLEKLALTYSFWGQQPPSSSAEAFGILQDGEHWLLVQAMPAKSRTGQLILDGFRHRPFMQHRYILVPHELLAALGWRVWLIFPWLFGQGPIPVFDKFIPNLPPLLAPVYDKTVINSEEETKKLQRMLYLAGKQDSPALLSALATLINNQNLLIDSAIENHVSSEDLVEGIWLLLPANVRSQIAFARGFIDEGVCSKWANLMIKVGVPRKWPDNLLWLKRATNQFFPQGAGRDLFESQYTNLIRPLATNRDTLPKLLAKLDSMNEGAASLNALPTPEIIFELIPMLPDEQERVTIWHDTLTRLSPTDWQKSIVKLTDPVGLTTAWGILKVKVIQNAKVYAPLISLLWDHLSDEQLADILQEELVHSPELAQTLHRNGVLNQLKLDHSNPNIRQALHALYCTLIGYQAQDDLNAARELVFELAHNGPMWTSVERFELQDALFSKNITNHDLFLLLNNDFAFLLPTISSSTLAESKLYRELRTVLPDVANTLKSIVAQQGTSLELLPDFALKAEMNSRERTAFYAAALTAWSPSYRAARILLIDLLQQSYTGRDASTNAPWSLRIALGEAHEWFFAHMPPDMIALLRRLEVDSTWDAWQQVATALLDTPLQQLSFLDTMKKGRPLKKLLPEWLKLLARNEQVQSTFHESYACQVLQDDGTPQLKEALRVLRGEQSIPPVMPLLSLIETTQKELELPPDVICDLCELLPSRLEGHYLSLEQVATLLTIYLYYDYYDQAINLKQSKVWNLLKKRSSRLAHAFEDLLTRRITPDSLQSQACTSPEWAPLLAYWLWASGRVDWINGSLLHLLATEWLASGQAEQELLRSLTTQTATVSDWLTITYLCWLPGNQYLQPAGEPPTLDHRQKTQLVGNAREMVRRYSHPDQTQRLLDDCYRWGLDQADLEEILKAVPPKACSVKLLRHYSSHNKKAYNPEKHQELLELALQLEPGNNNDSTLLETWLTIEMTHYLKQSLESTTLSDWRHITADEKLYIRAFASAVQQLADSQFNRLAKDAKKLRQAGLDEESRCIKHALHRYLKSFLSEFDAIKRK